MSSQVERRLLPPTLFILCLVASLLLHLFWPGRLLVKEPYNLLGAIVAGGGTWVLLSAHRSFLRSQTNIHTFKAPNLLIVEGLFRFSRNPMYLGFLSVLLGIAILLGTATPLLPATVFFLLANFWYIPFEEAVCLETFGTDYERYRERVRRWC